MARKSGSELVERRDAAPVAYGRRLNNRARALVAAALDRLTTGDMAAFRGHGAEGEHGRTFLDQLAYEMWAEPRASLARIEAATPSDEGEEAKGAAAQGTTNIGALYLLAMQGANKAAEPKVIEGAIGVQPAASDW